MAFFTRLLNHLVILSDTIITGRTWYHITRPLRTEVSILARELKPVFGASFTIIMLGTIITIIQRVG